MGGVPSLPPGAGGGGPQPGVWDRLMSTIGPGAPNPSTFNQAGYANPGGSGSMPFPMIPQGQGQPASPIFGPGAPNPSTFNQAGYANPGGSGSMPFPISPGPTMGMPGMGAPAAPGAGMAQYMAALQQLMRR